MSSSARFSGGRTPRKPIIRYRLRRAGGQRDDRAADERDDVARRCLWYRVSQLPLREHEARFSRHRWYRDHRPRALSIKWSEG
jgi:hypothetical protein